MCLISGFTVIFVNNKYYIAQVIRSTNISRRSGYIVEQNYFFTFSYYLSVFNVINAICVSVEAVILKNKLSYT